MTADQRATISEPTGTSAEASFPLDSLTHCTSPNYLRAIYLGPKAELSQLILETVLDHFVSAAQANQKNPAGLRTTCTEFEKLVAPGMWVAAQGKENSQAALRLIEPVLVAARVAFWQLSRPEEINPQLPTVERALRQRFDQVGLSGTYDRALAFYRSAFDAYNADNKLIPYPIIEFTQTSLWSGEALKFGNSDPQSFLQATGLEQDPQAQIISLNSKPMEERVLPRAHKLTPPEMTE